MFPSDLLDELSVPLPIEPEQIVHVLEFGLVGHVGGDTTQSEAQARSRTIVDVNAGPDKSKLKPTRAGTYYLSIGLSAAFLILSTRSASFPLL